MPALAALLMAAAQALGTEVVIVRTSDDYPTVADAIDAMMQKQGGLCLSGEVKPCRTGIPD